MGYRDSFHGNINVGGFVDNFLSVNKSVIFREVIKMNIDYRWINQGLRAIKTAVLNDDYSIEYVKARTEGELQELLKTCVTKSEEQYITYLQGRFNSIYQETNKEIIRLNVLQLIFTANQKA